MEILGSGGYGLIIGNINNSKQALKIFYDINNSKDIEYEYSFQKRIYEIIQGLNYKLTNDERYLNVYIPKIYEKGNKVIEFDYNEDLNKINLPNKFLYGISMDRIRPPKIDGFNENEQIHIGLGLHIEPNSSWLCENGITRGFYANTRMMDSILSEAIELRIKYADKYNLSKSYREKEIKKLEHISLSNIAYTLGKAYGVLIDNNIKPFDVEVVLSDDLKVYTIDFGKVYEYKGTKEDYYNDTSYKGLVSDSYVPHKFRKDLYWEDFYEGYFS